MNNNIISKLIHNANRQEFSLTINGAKAFITYTISDGIMYLNHTEVPAELRGKGIGKKLVEQTFEYLEAENIQAVAVCSYAKLIRDRNSKWQRVIS